MEPLFKVPNKNLVKIEELMAGGKPFYSSVKMPKSKPKAESKTSKANWDAVF